MPQAPLHGIAACVFDAYGTLFDYASAAATCRDVLGEKFAALTMLWRDKQLQYTWLRSLQGQHADFWQVTGDALDYALETLGLADPTLRQRLMQLYLRLDAFPEVPEALARIKRAGLQTAILSNGTPDMLRAVVDHARIGHLLDAVISVEEAGVFKTHPSVYRLAVERLGVPARAISFQSSNAWDAYAASAFGMRVVWCNRYDQKRERLPGAPDREITTLADLPALLGA
jgi:2-haloacid dehalogenase